MTVTTTTLTRAAGVAAAIAGLIFIGVQVNHPHMVVASVTTTDWKVRETLKVLMAALSLIGITGMYLRQVKNIGVLGLLGYVLFGIGYLAMLGVEFTGAVVLPSLAHTAPGYVTNVLAVAMGGTTTGDIGLLKTAIQVNGIAYLAGGLIFGIALFRARVLARWAAALLAVGTFSTLAIQLLPQINERLFALPTGVALVGLGYSLSREKATPAARPVPSPVNSQLDTAGAQ